MYTKMMENDNNNNNKQQHQQQTSSRTLTTSTTQTRRTTKTKVQDKWKCKCPTGYMGITCEISVCDNNPCQYGATCVTFPGSGYLCLCPFGKHGHYCEHSEYLLSIQIRYRYQVFYINIRIKSTYRHMKYILHQIVCPFYTNTHTQIFSRLFPARRLSIWGIGYIVSIMERHSYSITLLILKKTWVQD